MLPTSKASVVDVPNLCQSAAWLDPDTALSRIENLRKDQPIVVDFDETFFLRNSSQDFIRMVRPYVFGALLYKFLEIIRPWAWFDKGEVQVLTRDWFHVMSVILVFPWTLLVWRSHARKIAEVWTNKPLAELLKKRQPDYNVLCSQGFGPVVRPVLKHMGVAFSRVDTCLLG